MANSDTVNFGVTDYCVSLAMLGASLGIGLYHCVRGNRTTDDFLLASRSMSPAPIALSLTATYISSISVLGIMGEVYGHGILAIWFTVGVVLGVLIATHVFIPVLFPLKLDSINEYLERRFRSTAVKRLVMFTTSVSSLLYLGVCLYAPTLALESVTPIKSEVYIVLLGLIVTAYSSFGGMKAVVWTDAFQAIFLILGVIISIILATVVAGGPAQVWRTASEHGRADAFDMRLGLFVRHTTLNTLMKNTVTITAQYAFHQTTVQRLATLKSLHMAKVVLYLNMLGLASLMFLMHMGGMSIFAVYAGCDPITRGFISKKDQILPFFVMDYLGFLKGIPGLFVACLLCGTMSSISSFLNSLPTILWKDFISELAYFRTASERTRTYCTKLLSMFCSFRLTSSSKKATHCATMRVSSGHKRRAVQWAQKKGCPVGTKEGLSSGHKRSEPLDYFYGISYTYFSTLGCFTCMVVALVISFITGAEKLENINPSHVVHCWRKHVGRPSSVPSESYPEKHTDSSTAP
ncbi:Sodium/solute symporter [Trinorchestia longiramus]|nr:Sodium/solute symporter [Trinorchestia longiramus]